MKTSKCLAWILAAALTSSLWASGRSGIGGAAMARVTGPGSTRAFYGWWIVGAGFSLEALIGALMFHSYGAYVDVLREEFGWSKTMLSAAFAMARAESGILGPVQGWLTDRFGPQALIRVGMVIYGVGFILFSQITGPVMFFTPPVTRALYRRKSMVASSPAMPYRPLS